VTEISELRTKLNRDRDELRKVREEVEPSKRKEHKRLQELRAETRATAQRLQALLAEARAWKFKIEPERAEYADYFHAVASGEREADRHLEQRLLAAMRNIAPSSNDDPRLIGWYHTIELGNGLRSYAGFDLRSVVDLHGLPESLEGKTALDVGTCDGFWAFEMERRGADKVVGMDVDRVADYDWLPAVRRSKDSVANARTDCYFWLAHAMRGSRVQRKICSVYDLSPDSVGTYDVVFCGSLLLHVQNPLKALVNICSVTKGMAIVATSLSKEIEGVVPEEPCLSFGNRWSDLERGQLGTSGVYWHVNTRGLQEMMEYSGFGRTQTLEPVPMPPTDALCAVVIGYPEAPTA
jgi:tRNA (mo5U34)-methyltransferase